MEVTELKFRSTEAPTTLTRIAKAEFRLGLTFPDDYKEFLLLYNGGVSKVYRATFNDNLWLPKYWHSLCDVVQAPVDSLELVNEKMRLENWPRHLLIFGTDLAESMLLIDCIRLGNGRSAIGLYRVEESNPDNPVIEYGFGTFQSFISSLEENVT